MKIKKIISSALLATSAMTLYSYIQSNGERKDFREPKLLDALIERSGIEKRVPNSTGWIFHYAVGLGFAPVYHFLWDKSIHPSITSGVLLGAVNGAVGIGIWSTVLQAHPSPPYIDRKAFYRHLIFAHMVFGAFMALNRKSEYKRNLRNGN